MATFDALPGNQVTVATHAQKYLVTADAINRAAADLISISNQDDSVGKAFTAIRDLAYEVSKDIQQAESRYRQTATALSAYAVALGDAQEKALRAASAAGDGQHSLAGLLARRPDLEDKARVPDAEQLANQKALDLLDRRIAALEQDNAEAEALYNQAVHDRDEAADRAAGLIEDVVKDSPLNDGFWDNVKGFVEGIGDWITGVLGPILQSIIDIATAIGKILLAAIIVIALVLLVVAALLLIVIVFPALAGLVLPLAALLALVTPLLVAAIVGLAISAMIKETGTPTVVPMGSPETYEYPPRIPGTSDYGPGDQHRDPYYDLFAEQARIDSADDLDGDGVADGTAPGLVDS
ncbi:hypothetical protein F1C58_14315 [Glaciihabitans sp. INWT7]|uniref:hypothetical protein n=1 Tax=Glaciihabitans sp. INWT7 TaxID=2596912 RepID=UPI00162797E4|nr:hypothetical protein [Glaciihabitans sp. INWT7]QNE47955.1 hypothetical protein F1C58_14315 [Glaciihabitans sp. INWT7]